MLKKAKSQKSNSISATSLSQARTPARKTLSRMDDSRADEIGCAKTSAPQSPQIEQNMTWSDSDLFGSPCSKNSEPLPHATEMAVRRRDNDECTFVDPISGTKCGSRMQVQVDHVIPRALGGTNDPENLRCLCRTHNIMMAVHKFGAKFMAGKAKQLRH